MEVYSLSLFLEVPEVVTAIRKNLSEKIRQKLVRLHTCDATIYHHRRVACLMPMPPHCIATAACLLIYNYRVRVGLVR